MAKIPNHVTVEAVVAAAGGALAVAARLGIHRSAVYQWTRVPADRVLDLEAMSGISRHRIRPDVFGPDPKASRATSAA